VSDEVVLWRILPGGVMDEERLSCGAARVGHV
jgi:hypothetical protein